VGIFSKIAFFWKYDSTESCWSLSGNFAICLGQWILASQSSFLKHQGNANTSCLELRDKEVTPLERLC
jgi:hypothetical protein